MTSPRPPVAALETNTMPNPPSTVPMTVRRLRKSKGLTQAQLAELLGCEQSYISKIERGGQPASLDLAVGLAAHFGHPLTEFLDDRRRKLLHDALPYAFPASRSPSITEVAQQIAWAVAGYSDITPAAMWEHMPEFQRVRYLDAARAAKTLLAPTTGEEGDGRHG